MVNTFKAYKSTCAFGRFLLVCVPTSLAHFCLHVAHHETNLGLGLVNTGPTGPSATCRVQQVRLSVQSQIQRTSSQVSVSQAWALRKIGPIVKVVDVCSQSQHTDPARAARVAATVAFQTPQHVSCFPRHRASPAAFLRVSREHDEHNASFLALSRSLSSRDASRTGHIPPGCCATDAPQPHAVLSLFSTPRGLPKAHIFISLYLLNHMAAGFGSRCLGSTTPVAVVTAACTEGKPVYPDPTNCLTSATIWHPSQHSGNHRAPVDTLFASVQTKSGQLQGPFELLKRVWVG